MTGFDAVEAQQTIDEARALMSPPFTGGFVQARVVANRAADQLVLAVAEVTRLNKLIEPGPRNQGLLVPTPQMNAAWEKFREDYSDGYPAQYNDWRRGWTDAINSLSTEAESGN